MISNGNHEASNNVSLFTTVNYLNNLLTDSLNLEKLLQKRILLSKGSNSSNNQLNWFTADEDLPFRGSLLSLPVTQFTKTQEMH